MSDVSWMPSQWVTGMEYRARPELLIVLPQGSDPDDVMRMHESWLASFPGMPAGFIAIDGVELYHLAPDGDYERHQPLTVLDGQAVADHLRQREERS